MIIIKIKKFSMSSENFNGFILEFGIYNCNEVDRPDKEKHLLKSIGRVLKSRLYCNL